MPKNISPSVEILDLRGRKPKVEQPANYGLNRDLRAFELKINTSVTLVLFVFYAFWFSSYESYSINEQDP